MNDGRPPTLDSSSFADLLRGQDPFNQKGRPRIDLSKTRFITPAGLVQLTALCYLLAAQGKRPLLQPWIHGHDFGSYLLRSGFYDAVRRVADFNPIFHPQEIEKRRNWRGTSDVILEVTELAGEEDVGDVVSRIRGSLLSQLQYSKFGASDIAIAISEICQNIHDHNRTAVGFVALQVYKSGPNRHLKIGISDTGGGLASSLQRNQYAPAFIDDLDAIRRAVQLGVSEFDSATRGVGLPLLIRKVHERGGAIQITSGRASVRFRADREQPVRGTCGMAGVHISITLPVELS